VSWSGRIGSGIALGAAVALPLVLTQASRQFLWTEVLVYAAIALSVVVLTGYAGQLSLSQFAFAGLGALSTAVPEPGHRLPARGALASAPASLPRC
jgi:ABC-type branched-subunit amino acid transport system permease subunit